MQNKILLYIICFCGFITLAQNKVDDYTIYSKTIDFGINSFNADIELQQVKSFQIAIVVQNLNYEFKKDHLLLKNIKKSQNIDFKKTLKWMVTDSIKRQNYVNNKDILRALPDLDSTFINHPRITKDSLKTKTLKVTLLKSELFNKLIDNSTNSYNKRWKKINRKFKHSIAFGLSKIKYVGKFASLYYWVDCGKFGYCKSEHVIIFEKIDDEWKILNDIHLWISND